IYSPENFGQGKFRFSEAPPTDNSYDGDQKIYAGYLMADIPFTMMGNQLRVVGGARLENSQMNVHVFHTADRYISSEHQNNDLLPSVNLTYAVTGQANLRMAYSQSVNRPEFRELAKTSWFDYVNYELVYGNPDLERSLIHNYDVRIEVFPEA